MKPLCRIGIHKWQYFMGEEGLMRVCIRGRHEEKVPYRRAAIRKWQQATGELIHDLKTGEPKPSPQIAMPIRRGYRGRGR